MARLKLSGAAMLLIIVVPLFMYAGALLIGIQLGRALERRPDSDSVSFSIRGALAYVAKELWGTNNVFGGRRGRDEMVLTQVLQPVPASLFHEESSDDTDCRYSKQQQHPYIPLRRAVEVQDDGSSSRKTPPQAQRFPSNQYVDADGRVHVDTEDAHFVMEKPSRGRKYAQAKHPGSSPSSTADDVALEMKATPRSKAKRYHISNHTSPRGLISVGPWGGSGGQPFYMHGSSVPRLRSIVLQHSISGIHSLACDYYYYFLAAAGDDDGIRTAGPWGRSHSFGSTGRSRTEIITLSAGEHLIAVEGTTGHFSNAIAGAVVTSLAFRTSAGRTYGPYGNTAGTTGMTPFSVPAADGACIVGFWGRSGWLLDAIGVYLNPCGASSSSNPYPAYNTTSRRARQG